MCRHNPREETKVVKTKRKSKAASISKMQPRTGAEQKSITSKPRAQSKQQKVLGLLRHAEGTTIAAIMKATNWQRFSASSRLRGILFAHPSDEIAQLTIDLWPPCPISGFPAPKRFEAEAMPSQDSFRLHDPGYVEQTGPNPRHPYQQRPITAVQPQPRRRSPQCDVKLMMKKQVLGFQPASRLENVDNEDPEHVQDRKHRSG
jgi:hypothetical protein